MADLLLHPSFHDGFGVPILDSIDAGGPSTKSDVCSSQKLPDPIAMMVDPESADVDCHYRTAADF